MEEKAKMLTRRSFIEFMVTTGVVATGAVALGGCAQQSSSDTQKTDDATETAQATTSERPSTVIDAAGREVAVPERIERIGVTCYGGAIQEMCVLGGVDRVVVTPETSKNSSFLASMFPQLNGLPDAGTFDDVNVETLAAAEPDFVFVSSTSAEGNQKIEDIGLPTYTLSTAKASVESLRTEFENVGILLGTEHIAMNLLAFWDDVIGRVEADVESVPKADRLSVYRCGAAITKANHTPWAGNWIRTAGGISAAEDGTTGDVSIETIAGWNPDIIIANDPAAILADESLQELSAVKNKRVYCAPKGAMGWDIPSPEVPLGFAWLAQALYSDNCKDINLEEDTKAFYQEFYNYELSDKEYQGVFA